MTSNNVAPQEFKSVKTLAVSFAFPPLAYPRSIQVARLLKYLNLQTLLICADERGARRDPTLEPDAEKNLVECIRVPFSVSFAQRTANRLAHKFYRPLWNRWNRAPDGYGAWRHAALAAFEDYALSHDYAPDVIASFSQPAVGHLVGLELKKRFNRPWIAHFSDPWADNPFHDGDARTRARNLALEREVAERADRLVFTSSETVEMVFAKYPSEWRRKALVLPQSFDAALFPPRDARRREGPLRIRYVGNFYGPRTPAPLLRALKSLRDEEAALLEDVRFEMIGVTDSKIEMERDAAGLPESIVTILPPVGYRESLRLMTEADALLIIDAPADVSVFLPSKLIEYAGAGRPILGFTPRGAASNLIERLGGWTADPSNVAAGREALKDLLVFLRKRRSESGDEVWGEPSVRESYEAAHLAREFERIVRELAD